MLGKFDVALGAQPTGLSPWRVREPSSKSPLQIYPLPNFARLLYGFMRKKD
jgi:hypothetical protein